MVNSPTFGRWDPALDDDKANRASSVDAGKALYVRPTLQVFGSVSALTKGNGGTFADSLGTLNRMNGVSSDPRVKENVVRIGVHPLGIGLYLFDYKPEFRGHGGDGRQFGVMADEVEAVMPGAVSVRADGYKVVDYAMLGVHRPTQSHFVV